ncbi:MAG: hypothetical protein U9O94_08345 [Nanoarchaeota archaeon]|nr:hypothetical protein [Nanoarchaeota archaeon]
MATKCKKCIEYRKLLNECQDIQKVTLATWQETLDLLNKVLENNKRW